MYQVLMLLEPTPRVGYGLMVWFRRASQSNPRLYAGQPGPGRYGRTYSPPLSSTRGRGEYPIPQNILVSCHPVSCARGKYVGERSLADTRDYFEDKE